MCEMVLTNNFYTYVRSVILSSSNNLGALSASSTGWIGVVNLLGTLKDKDGSNISQTNVKTSTSLNTYNLASLSHFNYTGTNMSPSYFEVGSGNTPASVLDFKLERPITDVALSYNTISEYSNNRGKLSVLVSIVASADITIKEIGWYKTVASSASNPTAKYILIGRCVLDTPIILSAGESTMVTVSIAF